MSDKGIDEQFPTNPINPYGMSKLMSENILQDTAKANKDFKYVILDILMSLVQMFIMKKIF